MVYTVTQGIKNVLSKTCGFGLNYKPNIQLIHVYIWCTTSVHYKRHRSLTSSPLGWWRGTVFEIRCWSSSPRLWSFWLLFLCPCPSWTPYAWGEGVCVGGRCGVCGGRCGVCGRVCVCVWREVWCVEGGVVCVGGRCGVCVCVEGRRY